MAVAAARIAEEATAYRSDIMRSMRRSLVERDGMKVLPVFPQTKALLERVGYLARDYYTLVAGDILETGFLAADSEAAGWITEFQEAKGGLVLGMARFGEGIDHAYTYGYWLTCLKRGAVEKALLGFYASLAYGMSRQTYAACETEWLGSGSNYYHLPHTYSNTQQLRLLRNMLLREDGATLLIGQAIPRPWLGPGLSVEIHDAPTTFGSTSYRIAVDATGDTMTMHLDPPTRNPPETIRVHLRHPREKVIAQIVVNGEPGLRPAAGVIDLSGLTRATTLRVRFR